MFTTIGKKLIMALTGLLLIGFVVIHLSGNFLLYIGFENYNAYAQSIHSTKLLYVAEAILYTLFLAHIILAIQTSRENRKARPEKYALRRSKQDQGPWTPSAVMFVSGAILLGFLILHLSDFTFLLRLKGPAGESPADKALRILQDPISAPVYFVGSLLLGWHLWHGFQSSFQTFGLRNPKYTPWIKRLGVFLSIVLAVGYASFPVWAYLKKWGIW